MAPPKSRFSLFGIGGGGARAGYNSKTTDPAVPPPVLKLQTDKNVYRPRDPVIITIEIQNHQIGCSLLVEKLSFEIKGIENWILNGSQLQSLTLSRREVSFFSIFLNF